MSNRSVSFRVFLAASFSLGVVGLGALVLRLDAFAVDADFLTNAIGQPRELTHTWSLVRGKHWQIDSPDAEERAVTDAREGNRGLCGEGMVEVRGKAKIDPPRRSIFDPASIEESQKRTCKKWINKEYPERCAEFDRDAWLAMSGEFATRDMAFCMDRFEYPNKKAAYPTIFVSYHESKALCAEEGKRLCTEDEWTFACEGEEATPYPYGYVRNPEACAIDSRWRPYNEHALIPRDGPEAKNELDKLWQGGRSGDRPQCKSVFGVYDLTGNIDEWTTGTREGERPSILKGGYWGPVRTRCRPSTRSHDENHVFYQQGFRCCSDVGAASSAPKPTTAGKAFPIDPALGFTEALTPLFQRMVF